MEISNRVINEILNYLAKQPYKDVVNMITSILQEQQAQKQQQEELPLDDTH
tara:strand:+ start:2086 stop:2238 length:153 start_codon:yes stop_codon:yes gene_type:complete